jgi:hypothetical protein
LPIVPNVDIMPPMSGIPESENKLPPLPASPPEPTNADPLEFWYQYGK